MRFLNTPRTIVVQWVSESSAQRILAALSGDFYVWAVFDHTKFGKQDYYNVYEIYTRKGNKLHGYVLHCYAGGAYIVRPTLPSEPRSAAQRGTVQVNPKIAYQDELRDV